MNNTITFNEIDVNVHNLLAAKGIKMTVRYHGAGKKDGWDHDAFRVTFSQSGKDDFSVDYHTGTGHRVGRPAGLTFSDKSELAKVAGEVHQVQESAWTREDRQRNDFKAVSFGYRVYVPSPSAASVLWCNLTDLDFGSETFEDFCSNCGYDTDSRKALEMYLQCQTVGNDFRKFLGNALIEEIRELTEDY